MSKSRKPKHKDLVLEIPKIPSYIRPTSSRIVTGVFLRPISRIPTHPHAKPKKQKHKRVRVPRIPGVRNLNIIEPVGYDAYETSTFVDTLSSSGTQHQNSYVVVGNNTRTGAVNPKWKDLTRLGVNATNQMVAQNIFLERSFWSGYYIGTAFSPNGAVARKWNYAGGAFLTYGNVSSNTANASIVADVHNRCIMKFLEEVSSAQSSDNLTGRSIKHFKHDVHSTLHPMAGIREKINSYLVKLEKVPYGKLKGASLYSTITQAYLEFKFGVEPFVTDISDIIADMVIRDRKRNPSVPVQATASHRYLGTSVLGTVTGVGYMSILNPHQYTRITSVYSERLRGAVRTGINDDGKLGLIQDNKLLPKDWLPTAFSIMPYAWMINYFTNIREIIDAAAFRFSDLVWGCHTLRDVTTMSYSDVICTPTSLVLPGQFGNFAAVSSGGNAIIEITKVSRFAITPSALVPTFAFSIPVSSTPWVNMMAAFSPRIFKIVNKLFT